MRSASFQCDTCQWSKKDLFDRKDKVPKYVHCTQCGKRAYRIFGMSKVRQNAGWPRVSEAVGIHPDQIAEATETDRKLGVECKFTSDGGRIFEDRGHERRWCRAHGIIHRNGGYGDS